MAETKNIAVPEDSYPEPDLRTEGEREREALMSQRKGTKVFYEVPWKAGIIINGIEYRGMVKVDTETRDELARMSNARARAESLGRHGDGNTGLHSVSGTHNIFGF